MSIKGITEDTRYPESATMDTVSLWGAAEACKAQTHKMVVVITDSADVRANNSGFT